jgi:hypothetical protein
MGRFDLIEVTAWAGLTKLYIVLIFFLKGYCLLKS